MPAPTRYQYDASTAYTKASLFTQIIVVPHSPLRDSLTAIPTVLKPGFTPCTIEGVPNIPYEPINERDIMSIGKTPVSANDGFKMSKIDITLKGNAYNTVCAMRGINPLVAGNSSLIHGQNITQTFSLIILSFSMKTNLMVAASVFVRCRMEVKEFSGIQEGDTTQPVTIWSDQPVGFSMNYPFVPCFEVWYNPTAGGIVNGAAIGTAFTLGTGNNSLGAATTDLDAWAHRSDLSAAGNRFFGIIKNGVPLDLTTITYTVGVINSSEGIFTLPSATVADDYLVALYPLNVTRAGWTDTTPPGYRMDLSHTPGANVLGSVIQSGEEFITSSIT